MHEGSGPSGARRWLAWSITGLGGALGLVAGYQFGARVAGFWLGIIAGLNLAILASILAGAAADRLLKPDTPGPGAARSGRGSPPARD